MSLGIGLYLRRSAEAVETYIEAFGWTLGYHVKNADGSYFHSELMDGGEEIVSVVESGEDACHNPVHLGYTFESRAALEKAFALLKEGGTVLMEPCELPWSPWAAELTDRYGVIWYLSLPQHRPPEDFSAEAYTPPA